MQKSMKLFKVLKDNSITRIVNPSEINDKDQVLEVQYCHDGKIYSVTVKEGLYNKKHYFQFYLLNTSALSVICNEKHYINNNNYIMIYRYINMQIRDIQPIKIIEGNQVLHGESFKMNDKGEVLYYMYFNDNKNVDEDIGYVIQSSDHNKSISLSDESFFKAKLLYGTDFLFHDEMYEHIISTLNFEALSKLSHFQFTEELYESIKGEER